MSHLVAVMAELGHETIADIKDAYLAGMKIALPETKVDYMQTQGYAATLDPIWHNQDQPGHLQKQQLLKALVATICHDHVVTRDELDLLRVVCAIIHITLPMICEYWVSK